MIKITWAAGHGLYTAGKRTPDGQAEWTFNNKVVLAGMNLLSHYEGVSQLRLDDPTGKIDIPLLDRSNRALAWGTNFHVDAHHNALNGIWKDAGIGIETFAMVGTNKYEESLKAAKLVHAKYVKAMGLKDRGIKSSNLHMLRTIGKFSPAILTEGGFMDSRFDVAVMCNDQKLKDQGEAIALGIVEYFGLKKKGEKEVKKVADKIKLTTGQQNAKEVLVKHGLMAANYEVNDTTILTLVTMLAPLLNKLEAKGSI